MPDVFSKLPAGSPVNAISRTAYNRMIDMLMWWLNQESRTGRKSNQPTPNNNTILIKNTTGDPLDRLAVLGIDDILYAPEDDEDGFKNRPVVQGVLPTSDHVGNWCVLTRGLADGEIGPAIVAGIVVVQVYVNNPADCFCDIIDVQSDDDGDYYLGTGSSGAEILWMEDVEAESVAWAIVRMGSRTGFTTIRLQEDLGSDADSTAKGKLYVWNTDDSKYEEADDDTTVTVRNSLQCCAAAEGDVILCRPFTGESSEGETVYEALVNLTSDYATATLSDDLDSDDDSVDVEDITPIDGKLDSYAIDDDDPSDTASNPKRLDGKSGTKVWLKYNYADQTWDIVAIKTPLARFISGTTVSEVNKEETFDIDNVVGLDGDFDGDTSEVSNPRKYITDSGASVVALWNGSAYEAIDATCKGA